MGTVRVNRPAVTRAGSLTKRLRFTIAAGWLLLAAIIFYVPKPRRPSGELPTWKLVVWFVLLAIFVFLVAFIWKSGGEPGSPGPR